MADLSSILPTMPTYFGAQLPVSPPSSGSSPLMDALRTVTAVKPAVAQNPFSMVPAAAGPPTNPQSHFGALLPTMSPPAARIAAPPARPVAPAAPGGGTGGAPPETGGAMVPPGGGAPPEIGGMAAAPNVIQGGVPGATMPSEVPGMLHPADHAIAYEQHLARQRDAQPFNGTNVNEFTTLGPDSPRMEGPAPAAPNVIRAGVPSGGGAPASGMSLMQLEAIKPFLLGRQEAMLDPTKRILNEIVGHAAAERDQVLNDAKATPIQKKVAINTYMLEARRALYASGALGYASAGNAKVDPTTGEIVQ